MHTSTKLQSHAFFALTLLLTSSMVKAQSLQLGSSTLLKSSDSTLIYPEAVNSTLASPYLGTVGGTTVTITNPAATFTRRDQNNGWSGNFAPGTPILWTAGTGSGIFTLSFSRPLTEIGLQAQNNSFGSETFTIETFNGNHSLGLYSVSGTSNNNSDNSAPFLGVLATQGNVITSVVLTSSGTVNYGIGPVTFGVATSQVPEPGNLALLVGIGAGSLSLLHRRRRK